MTIYISRRREVAPDEVHQATINAFANQVEPCPCGSEEFILRFGNLPYLVCLACGKVGRDEMTGPNIHSLGEIEGKVPRYLEDWRTSRNSLAGNSDFRDFALQATFKIVIGGEISRDFNVGPVDSSYPSKVEALYQRGR